MTSTTDTLIYGTGLYSFFDSYSPCSKTVCQASMVSIDKASSPFILNLNTCAYYALKWPALNKFYSVAAASMLDYDGKKGPAADPKHAGGFATTVALWTAS